jgi:uncharacterized protein
VVEAMARDLGVDVRGLMRQPERIRRIDIQKYVDDCRGLPTLRDIVAELEKPGRDPRAEFVAVGFDPAVTEFEHVQAEMVLNGMVTNVTQFGAFVDIGVHQDGLVHVSELAHRFVKDPAEVVKVGERVKVKVINVDYARRRIGLSIKQAREPARGKESVADEAQHSDKRGPKPTHSAQRSAARQPFNNPFLSALSSLRDKK